MIRLKSVYAKPSAKDGFRVLVERFWPRELDEKHAKLDLWLKEVAPSAALHRRFGEDSDPKRRQNFEDRYWNELVDKRRSIKLLRRRIEEGPVTLLHESHHPDRSAALVLKRFLEESGG